MTGYVVHVLAGDGRRDYLRVKKTNTIAVFGDVDSARRVEYAFAADLEPDMELAVVDVCGESAASCEARWALTIGGVFEETEQ